MPAIKTDSGKWDLTGSYSRVIKVNYSTLDLFSNVYDKQEVPAFEATLPCLHSTHFINVLKKLYVYPRRIGDFKNHFSSTVMFDETAAQRDNTITRDTVFPDDLSELILSGPHFFIGSPSYKTPKRICKVNSDYDVIDLNSIDKNYLPRSNYKPVENKSIYIGRVPKFSSSKKSDMYGKPMTDFFRLCFRGMLNSNNERTLVSCIMPPDVGHINGVQSTAFLSDDVLLSSAAISFSLVGDFYIKSSGRSNLMSSWHAMPCVELSNKIKLLILTLNCINKNFIPFWNKHYHNEFKRFRWAKVDERLNNNFFFELEENWTENSFLKTDYSRRQATIEIDVIVAKTLNLTIEELQTIYRVQFPVLRNNELDTWYDRLGRIVFTVSKGLVGVGLDRKYNKKNDFKISVKNGVFVDGSDQIIKLKAGTENNPWNEENGQIGWEDIKDLKSGIVTKTYMDDTVPNGPVERTIEYHAPFDRCDREEDYRIVWAEFERRIGTGS